MTQLQFTKQDALTFLIGMLAGVGWEVGDALIASEALFADWQAWAQSLGVGSAAATGRWIVTYLTLRGFQR